MRLLGVILLSAAMGAGCGERVRPRITAVQESSIPDQESWKSKVTFSDSARVRAVMWAGHIAVFQEQRYTLLGDSIHVDFYNSRGEHTSVLTARRGKVNDETRDLEAYENVVVVSDSGTTLRTDRLFWNNSTQEVHTDSYVDISSPTERIRGQGLVSDQSLRNYRIFRVTGQAVSHD